MTEKTNKLVIAPYVVMTAVVALLIGATALFSTSAKVEYSPDASGTRDGYQWSDGLPVKLAQSWKIQGYTDMASTPGATVVSNETSVSGIDSATGDVTWTYSRPDSTVCDIAATGATVTAVFNPGGGCTDMVTLDPATGEYLYQAKYATDSQVGKVVYGREKIALVTKNHVRLLRNDLVPMAEFGDRPDPIYGTDQEVSDCEISDVVIGPESFIVASKCSGESTYHVRAVEAEPEEHTEGNIIVDVDSGSANPVTLPAVSRAMFTFVTSDVSSASYVWELTKGKNEVARFTVQPNEYAYGYQDIPYLGYVWRVGNTLNVRSGSEDLSKSNKLEGVIGEPIEVNGDLLVPRSKDVVMWNPKKNVKNTIPVDGGLTGTKFSFSGGTVMVLDNGVVRGYSAQEK